jgi:predicted amidophosphoribosyltransferase
MWFPESCARCGVPGRSPCPACTRALRPAPAAPVPHGLDSLGALVAYDDAARPLVVAVKYRNARSSLRTLAPAVASLAPRLGADAVVTWAPTTGARRRARGFDQARVLAELLGRRLGRPVVGLLSRTGRAHQTGQGRASRLAGPTFVAARRRVPAEVVVVDDVCTTGATLSAAAAALRVAGAQEVHGLVLARTPEDRVAA